jgi:L-threonylcarbamoyladenylate synthase
MDGQIIAVPTETVYGLAANALDPHAIEKIFIAKGRPKDNPLIVHIGLHDDIEKYAKNIPKSARILAKAFWPGPLTIILEKKSCIPDAVSAGQNTVGLRMPNHPLLQELLSLLPFPLAAPSANQFMYVSPVTAEHVL